MKYQAMDLLPSRLSCVIFQRTKVVHFFRLMKSLGALIFLFLFSAQAYAQVKAYAYGDGSINITWPGPYGGVQLSEAKNKKYQRTIQVPGKSSSYTVTGRSDGIWSYSVSGWVVSGGGCNPNCPFAFLDKINRNPLFFWCHLQTPLNILAV
ncbi:hypothetical protein [Microbulbifer sp. JTAC008]|uniref:hypothetical protein n=1 Tax=unclassified Microbulbifer TaxID=2619833 RepID=UPI0040398B5A